MSGADRSPDEPVANGRAGRVVRAWEFLRSRIFVGIASAALVALTTIICYDVICRYLLNAPSQWGYEISKYLMAVVVMFGGAHTVSQGAQIRVDLFYDRMSARQRAAADSVACVLGILFGAVLTWQSFALVRRSLSRGAQSVDLNVPLAWPQFLVVVGSAMIVIECVLLLARSARVMKEAPR